MSDKEPLSFTFFPADETEFIRIESEYRTYFERNEPVPPALAKRFIELLYSKQTAEAEFSEAYRDLVTVYLRAIRIEVAMYFQTKKGYWFKIPKDSPEFSLEIWLEKIFEGLKNGRLPDRSDFLNFVANDLFAYTQNINPQPLSPYKVFVITGYIGAMFKLLTHPKDFDPTKSSYRYYRSYLSDTVSKIYRG